MALDFGTDEPVVGNRMRKDLIRAVLGASNADETRWLEWKTGLDVATPHGAFTIAKAILGFANRMPDVACRWVGGHAYLLVGVEEDNLPGVTRYDSADVDPWLARYLGGFDRYDWTYVPFDNGEGVRDVMMVDVAPPRWGDPLHPLRKAYEAFPDGVIFHRYHGRTQPAKSAEVDALSDRARRHSQRIDVDVDAASGTVALVPDTEDLRQQTLHYLRESLTSQLEGSEPGPRAAPSAGLTVPYHQMLAGMKERRSPEEFREEVEEYLRDLDAAMQQQLARTIDTAGTPMQLMLTNPGEKFLDRVQVVLTLPGHVRAHAVDEDDIVWPDEPAEYGTATSPGLRLTRALHFPFHSLYAGPTTDIEQEQGHTVIRFVPVDLRPHETVPLDPVTLHTTEDIAQTFTAEWRATATNVSGTKRGTLAMPTQEVAIDPPTALTNPE